MLSTRFVASFAVLALIFSGCASPPIKVNKAVCVVALGALGAGAGAAIRNNTQNSADDSDVGAAAAIGGASGAALGALLCGAEEAKPAPPPPPPPRAAPAPAPAPAPKRIVLRGVNFDFDKASIRDDAQVVLDAAVEVLNENPSVRVDVAGHTDATGAEDYNQGLSERRAKSVVDYLTEHGVSGDRLQAVGQGESSPVASNDTKDGRAQNRRVELTPVP